VKPDGAPLGIIFGIATFAVFGIKPPFIGIPACPIGTAGTITVQLLLITLGGLQKHILLTLLLYKFNSQCLCHYIHPNLKWVGLVPRCELIFRIFRYLILIPIRNHRILKALFNDF